MSSWRQQLEYNPFRLLVNTSNKAIKYFCHKDLLEDSLSPLKQLWQLRVVDKIITRQTDEGSWSYPGGGKPHIRSQQNYDQLETYRIVSYLIEKYGLNKQHPAIRKAADYLFGFQTEEGDFRGIYGTQYSPNYSAAIMELLIKAGYVNDKRINLGLKWLLSIRQDDGGWTIPLRTHKVRWVDIVQKPEPILPDTSKPFSHLVTGVVLRSFAAHPKYRKSMDVFTAGQLLASRFFKSDIYSDRRTPDFWTRFSYPFWFTDLLSALDSLSWLGFKPKNPELTKALQWFVERQQQDGGWKLKIIRGSDKDLPLWLHLAICRVFKRIYEN